MDEVAADTGLARPFAALRPAPGRAGDVCAPPYDVLDAAEARERARGRPWSFLHVSRPEIDLPPGADPHGEEAYDQAARALNDLVAGGVLIRDAKPCYYVYRLETDDHEQTGIAAAASVAGYRSGRIRRHEHTRPDKEADRARQIEAVGAHTGPVFVVHRPDRDIANAIAEGTCKDAVADVVDDGGVRHRVWVIEDDDAIARICAAFEGMKAVYIADGHHRAAAAARVADAFAGRGDATDANTGQRFLTVSFPADRVRILDYNRVVRDLNGRAPDQFLRDLAHHFRVVEEDQPARPRDRGEFGMVLKGRWYRLIPTHRVEASSSPVERLDIAVLSRLVLEPVLGIGDPRTDPRIDFVGGSRGLAELERRVTSSDWAVGFSLYPTSLDDLIAVADAGEVMPPKSTWFDPKLADGLLSLPLR